MNAKPQLSVIVTTRNEEANIENCLVPFESLRKRGVVELIVVDNGSADSTCAIAKKCGARVFEQGPERSAQRNRGVAQAAADFVMVLDADMIVNDRLMDEILALLGAGKTDALYVREVRTGVGLRARARNFERSFYDGTCVDMVRVFNRDLFLSIGGFDLNLCGPEDWDLNRRIGEKTSRISVTENHLVHNERQLSLKKVLEKKAYYAQSFAKYKDKWHHDEIIRKQFGFAYRYFGVFVEDGKWKKIIRHPVLFSVMFIERILVGFTYLKSLAFPRH